MRASFFIFGMMCVVVFARSRLVSGTHSAEHMAVASGSFFHAPTRARIASAQHLGGQEHGTQAVGLAALPGDNVQEHLRSSSARSAAADVANSHA
jgi:hypothetical protein